MRRLLPLLLVALAGCATPAAPTGGPADSTPPTLVASLPARGATNVTDRTVRLAFSERLQPAAASAVTITPVGDARPQISVRADEVEIRLPELRDSTTYVVTIGTEFADQRGVRIRAPITLAFSTGNTIDGGAIAGSVRTPDGAAAPGLDVWAFALADSAATPTLDGAPDYRTETGADGAFRLDYLRPGPYFVAAVDDRNQSGRADAGERFAAPPRAVVRADTTDAPPLALIVTALDSIPPVAQRARALSDRRVAVRFSEAVTLVDRSALAIADSASGAALPATVYQTPEAPFEIVAVTASAMSGRVVVSGTGVVADSAGLAAAPFRFVVDPPARADTAQARVVGFVPARRDSVVTLRPGEAAGVRFAVPPSPGVVAGLAVMRGGERVLATFETSDGVTFTVDSLAGAFRLVAPSGDSTRAQAFAVPAASETGGLVGRVTAYGPVVIEATPEVGPPIVVRANADGTFAISGLLPGSVALRAFVDRDGDGRWSGGRLRPYLAPEPLVVLPPATVRARWETEIDPVTL
ncbi:Ig-like domain-containing protein [Rubrivirga sp. IMCC45206]|uniref:Ig-like domain-containing protein n=1 Tax=Rubrivirga sp. IMCC45206 TaxID=3391614 RepID=UPI00398FD262